MVTTLAQTWSGGPGIRYRGETFRTQDPKTTWHEVGPVLDRVGITRVADITGLDDLGIPTHVAYRPVGRTLAVSVGTGLTQAQSQVSAVMENIETWHAENAAPATVTEMPSSKMDLGYGIRSLALQPRSPVNENTLLDWTPAAGVLTGRPSHIPRTTLFLDAGTRTPGCDHRGPLFSITSNGLATGNTFGESLLHGMLETAERDAWAESSWATTQDQKVIDPRSTDNAMANFVLDALEASDSIVWLYDITNRLGVPTYLAHIWSESVPMQFGGVGCHLDPGVAVGRALAEAAQSRLVAVAGARDDIADAAYRRPLQSAVCPAVADPARLEPMSRPAYQVGEIDEMIRTVAEQIWETTGYEPLVVDLTNEEIGIAATKVYSPGLRMYDHRLLTSVGIPAERGTGPRR